MKPVVTCTVIILVISANAALARSRIDDAACFWGRTMATVQLAETLCLDKEPTESAEDTFEVMQGHREFVRCYKTQKSQLFAKRDVVKADTAKFCSEAATLKDFADREILKPKELVTSFTKDSTLSDWLRATEETKLGLISRIAPAVTKSDENSALVEVFLLECLNGMSRKDGTSSSAANRIIDRSVKIADAAALCALSK